MPTVTITQEEFLDDRQGRTFADVVNDQDYPFEYLVEFFNDENRQRRMEEAEIHHDRAPLAGVVRELEAHPDISQLLSGLQHRHSRRFRQAVGVFVRMIMERRGWRKTGRKGSLGVRASRAAGTPAHNTGGLAFWFIRAERFERNEGMPFRSVRERVEEFAAAAPQKRAAARQRSNNRRPTKRSCASGQSTATEPRAK